MSTTLFSHRLSEDLFAALALAPVAHFHPCVEFRPDSADAEVCRECGWFDADHRATDSVVSTTSVPELVTTRVGAPAS